ncbi:ATP-dependent DNA ligase [Candidatus Harpocratesius sp.]
MDFNYLVTFYERIASTPKRLQITSILAELFEKCKSLENLSDLPKIIYLTQGRLGSEIEDWPKFGVAEKMIIQALIKFTGRSENTIKDLINKKGDVGEAVQTILELREKKKVGFSLDAFTTPKSGIKKTNILEIEHLYRELEKLSLTTGEGSQDTKINIIMGLFRLSRPVSAKYIINIILANLRIGLAEMTILDALAIAFTSNKENRDKILYAYNIHPDLGEIAYILATKGITEMEKIKVQVGIPIRMMLASRIQYYQIQQKLGGKEFFGEYKYDGERVQVHKNGDSVVLFSRKLKVISEQYPDVVETVKKQVKAEKAIFEGEIVAMDKFLEKMLPFQVLSTRRRKYDITKSIQDVPVCLFCFDILFLHPAKESEKSFGNVMFLPFEERREILQKIIIPSDHIRLSIGKILHSTEEMVEFFKEARSMGAEGIMNKKMGNDAIYRAGNRGFLWIKLKGLEGAKMKDTIDVVIIGASWGKGRRKGFLSPFFGAVFNKDTGKFEFLTRIGSGFSDEMLNTLTERFKTLELKKQPSDVICSDKPDVWFKPEVVIEIMGDELTISNKADAGATPTDPNGYGLRFPVFQRLREDKSPFDITTTQEIVQLYQTQ